MCRAFKEAVYVSNVRYFRIYEDLKAAVHTVIQQPDKPEGNAVGREVQECINRALPGFVWVGPICGGFARIVDGDTGLGCRTSYAAGKIDKVGRVRVFE